MADIKGIVFGPEFSVTRVIATPLSPEALLTYLKEKSTSSLRDVIQDATTLHFANGKCRLTAASIASGHIETVITLRHRGVLPVLGVSTAVWITEFALTNSPNVFLALGAGALVCVGRYHKGRAVIDWVERVSHAHLYP